MALGKNRKRIFVKGLGGFFVGEVEPTPASVNSSAGYVGNTQFLDDPTMVDVGDEQGNLVQHLREAQRVSIESTLKQTSVDEISLLKDAATKIHRIQYGGMTSLDVWQYFAVEAGVIVPRIPLDFKPGERMLPLRVAALKREDLSYDIPPYYNFEAAAEIRIENMILWLNARLGLNRSAAQLLDSSSFGKHGTINSDFATIWQTGTTPEYFLRLDGVNDQVDVGDVCDIDDVSDFLVEMWVGVQGADASLQELLGKKSDDGTTAGFRLVRTAGNKIEFKIADGTNAATVTGTTNVLQNLWKHVAVAGDRNGNAQLYVNGATDGSAASIAGVTATAANALSLIIGKHNGGFGQVDVGAVRMYNFGAGGLPTDISTIVLNHYNAEKAGYGL